MDGWIDATFYRFDNVPYAVCYRHLMRTANIEGRNFTTFAYRLNPKEYSEDASEWVMSFDWQVKRSGRVILASIENQQAHFCDVSYQASGGTTLFIELKEPEIPGFSMPPRPMPQRREFYPKAFTKLGDMWANSVLDEIGPSPEHIKQMKLDEAIWRRGAGKR